MNHFARVEPAEAARPGAGGLRSGHQLLLLQGGVDLFPALVEAMDAARSVVHLETYIFEFAGSALSVAHALERAAQRGVQNALTRPACSGGSTRRWVVLGC